LFLQVRKRQREPICFSFTQVKFTPVQNRGFFYNMLSNVRQVYFAIFIISLQWGHFKLYVVENIIRQGSWEINSNLII
jgi:hypothetical protein